MSTTSSTISFAVASTFPPELLYHICQAIFYASLPPCESSLDPLFDSAYSTNATTVSIYPPPTGLPSSHPPATWPEPLSRRTLLALCSVNRAFSEAAKPWLWASVQVRLPNSWLCLVETILQNDLEQQQQVQQVHQYEPDPRQNEQNIIVCNPDPESVLTKALEHLVNRSQSNQVVHLDSIRDSVLATLSSDELPVSSIPPYLLSPPASREPSPRRNRLQVRAQSPGRWRLMRDISSAVGEVMSAKSNGGTRIYIPTPPTPSTHIHLLSFNHFRTIGMRLSLDEGIQNRFVTSHRLYRILQEMPNLLGFGATEYMDGALTLPVLVELLCRGSNMRQYSQISVPTPEGLELEDEVGKDDNLARMRDSSPLQALDLCGCVSAVFISALSSLVEQYLGGDISVQESQRGRRHQQREIIDNPVLTFPSLRRLGLRGAKSIASTVLEPFVLAFPNLTHLDLSGTRTSPDLLHALGTSQSLRLTALSLGRCPALTGESIAHFLTACRPSFTLTQLSLYGDQTFPTPLTASQLDSIIRSAPCFMNGNMEYLDLSSSPLTPAHLSPSCFNPQPKLRSLGLNYIPLLPLQSIAEFVEKICPQLEIITLVSTSPSFAPTTPGGVYLPGPTRGIPLSVALHQHLIVPLTKPPFVFSLSSSSSSIVPEAKTRLRVIELSSVSLAGLGVGSDGWRIVRSKGGRGWYVDSGAGWVAPRDDSETGSRFSRTLAKEHPLRIKVERLSEAYGNVSSGVGWHARKMEVLQGEGLLGREDGLYGAVSFAYSG